MFVQKRTFADPQAGGNAQRGYPAPGDGAQGNGYPSPAAIAQPDIPLGSDRPISGWTSLFKPRSQSGMSPPLDASQRRPAGDWNPSNPSQPFPVAVYGPDFSQGAARYVQNFGQIYTNPIGAGVVARHRPQASYGSAAQYVNGTIWWTSQAVPTSVNLTGLTDPAVLAAILGPINVQAAIRVG